MRFKRFKASGSIGLFLFIFTISIAGCHDGTQPSPPPDSGQLAAIISYEGSTAMTSFLAGRGASQTLGAIAVSVTLEGAASASGQTFSPLTAELTINIAQGRGTAQFDTVLVGVNYLLTAVGTFPDGTKETVKGLVEAVAKDQKANAVADARSTVAVSAMQAKASGEGKKLSQLSYSDFEGFLEVVDELHANGIDYSDITTDQVMDFNEQKGVVATVTVSPAETTIASGQSTKFSAAVKDSNGIATGNAPTWSVTGGGSITSAGVYTAGAAGTDTVTATVGTITDSATVYVIDSCIADADCDDANDLTLDFCVDQSLGEARCMHEAIACNVNADCSGSTPFCLDGETIDAACVACIEDANCDDEDGTTVDACEGSGTTSAACTNVACDVIACEADADCADSDALTLDSCSDPGTCDAACVNMQIACEVDDDCDDSNDLTIDKCANGGTTSAACANYPIACNNDDDCTALDPAMPACLNGGTFDAECVVCHEDAQCSGDTPACLNGDTANSQCIACNSSADCDDSDVTTADFCNDPATSGSSCSYLEPRLIATVDLGLGNYQFTTAVANSDGSTLYLGAAWEYVLYKFDTNSLTFDPTPINLTDACDAGLTACGGDPDCEALLNNCTDDGLQYLVKDPNRDRIFITRDNSYYVDALDLSTEAMVQTIELIYRMYYGMTASSDRDQLYVMEYDGPYYLGVIDLSLSPLSEVQTIDMQVGEYASDINMVVDDESGQLFAPTDNDYGLISAYDLNGPSFTSTMTAPGASDYLGHVAAHGSLGKVFGKTQNGAIPAQLHLFNASTQAHEKGVFLSTGTTNGGFAVSQSSSQVFADAEVYNPALDSSAESVVLFNALNLSPICAFEPDVSSSGIQAILVDDAARRVYVLHNNESISVIEYQDPGTATGDACTPIADMCDPTNESDGDCCVGEDYQSMDCNLP